MTHVERDWAIRLAAIYCYRFGSRSLASGARERLLSLLVELVLRWGASFPAESQLEVAISALRRSGTRLPAFDRGSSGGASQPVRGLNRAAEVTLAALIAAGDPRAIQEFDRRYRGAIEAMITSRFGYLAQKLDSFVDRLLVRHDGKPSKLGSYSGQAGLLTWLTRVADRELEDIRRAEFRLKYHSIGATFGVGVLPPPPVDGASLRQLDHPEAGRFVDLLRGTKPTLARRVQGDQDDPARVAERRELGRLLEQELARVLATTSPEDLLLWTLIFVDEMPQQDAGRRVFGARYRQVGPVVTHKKDKLAKKVKDAVGGLRDSDPEEFDRVFSHSLKTVLVREFPAARELAGQLWKAGLDRALDTLTP